MNENLKKYLQLLSEDEAFAKKACEANSIGDAIAIAKEKGIDLSEQEIRNIAANRDSPDPELLKAAGSIQDRFFCFFGKHNWRSTGQMRCDDDATFALAKTECARCGQTRYQIAAPDGKTKIISEAEYFEGLKLPPRDTWKKLSRDMK